MAVVANSCSRWRTDCKFGWQSLQVSTHDFVYANTTMVNAVGCFPSKGMCFTPLARDWFKNGHKYLPEWGLREDDPGELVYWEESKEGPFIHMWAEFKKSNERWCGILGLVTSTRKTISIPRPQRTKEGNGYWNPKRIPWRTVRQEWWSPSTEETNHINTLPLLSLPVPSAPCPSSLPMTTLYLYSPLPSASWGTK